MQRTILILPKKEFRLCMMKCWRRCTNTYFFVKSSRNIWSYVWSEWKTMTLWMKESVSILKERLKKFGMHSHWFRSEQVVLLFFEMIIISGKITKGTIWLVLCKYLQFLPCLIVGDGMICHPHNYLYRRLCKYTIKLKIWQKSGESWHWDG